MRQIYLHLRCKTRSAQQLRAVTQEALQGAVGAAKVKDVSKGTASPASTRTSSEGGEQQACSRHETPDAKGCLELSELLRAPSRVGLETMLDAAAARTGHLSASAPGMA
ncbi:unnamed protein product, partial [Polarella glacialis]